MVLQAGQPGVGRGDRRRDLDQPPAAPRRPHMTAGGGATLWVRTPQDPALMSLQGPGGQGAMQLGFGGP